MPLKIVAGRKKATKANNLYIRGSYLGVHVEKSCGTDRQSVARSILQRIQRQIERGEYPPREAVPDQGLTFATAAVAYMEAGRRRRYIARLIEHFMDAPLPLTQAAIDQAALELYPNVTAATRNAAVYTPVSAIHNHAGVEIKLKRPKGAKGRTVTDWLREDDAGGIIDAADKIDREFGLFLRFLLYTGLRLGEVLALRWSDLDLNRGLAWVRREKGGIQSDVRLRQDLLDRMVAHGPQEPHRRVFRFSQGGDLKHKLTRAKLAYLGLPCPVRRPTGWRQPPNRLQWCNFHTFRHTFSTWFRIYARGDVQGLLATGNWRDARSAARYAHVVAHEEWSRVDLFPDIDKRKKA